MVVMNRRTAALMTLLAPVVAQGAANAQSPSGPPVKSQSGTDNMPPSWVGREKIAIVIHDEMTALDAMGPHYFFGRMPGAEIYFVAKSLRPVSAGPGLTITPTATFETCPKDLDILMVPGGAPGTLKAMRDPGTIAFLADRGSRAKWVTSVCTGSLLLARAGLLRGYRATSHWIGRPLLKEFGAIEVNERVVFDRNRVTGAGVSAGLDFALSLVEKLRPLECAQIAQLYAEYAPEPPLHSGTPEAAPAPVIARARETLAFFVEGVRDLASGNGNRG